MSASSSRRTSVRLLLAHGIKRTTSYLRNKVLPRTARHHVGHQLSTSAFHSWCKATAVLLLPISRRPSWGLYFLRDLQEKREPTSGLEPLTCSSYECTARHLGATEQLTSRTAALSPPDPSTEATLNGGLVVAPTHRCSKARIALPRFFRHAPLPDAESHPGSVRRETRPPAFCSFAWMSGHPCHSANQPSECSLSSRQF